MLFVSLLVQVEFLILILCTYAAPFISIYYLSEKLRRVEKNRSDHMLVAVICGLSATILLVADTVLNPVSLEFGADEPLSVLHLAGEALMLAMMLMLYSMTRRIKSLFSGDPGRIPVFTYIFLSSFFALYSIFAVMVYGPYGGVVMSLNFILAIALFIFFFMATMAIAEIYERLFSRLRFSFYAVSAMVLYNLFYQFSGFFFKLVPPDPVYAAALDILMMLSSLVIIVLSAVSAWNSIMVLREPLGLRWGQEEKALMLFLNEMSLYIGQCAITLFRYGLEEYNLDKGTRVTFTKDGGLSDKSRSADVYRHTVEFFERYIGPIASRVSRDIKRLS